MTTDAPDLLAMARTALAASTAASAPRVQTHYIAAARVALEELRAAVAELDRLISAREETLARAAGPAQLQIGVSR